MADTKHTQSKPEKKPSTNNKESIQINKKTIEKEVKKAVKTAKKESQKVIKDVQKTTQDLQKKVKKELNKKDNKAKIETIKVTGDTLLAKVKELINEGNVRRITILNKKGKTIAEFPVTFGLLGAVIAPALAAIGTIAALVTECTIKIERK